MVTKAKNNTHKDAAHGANEVFDSVVAAGKDAVEQAVKAGADATARGYEKAAAAHLENLDAMARSYDEFAAAGKDNVDALITAGSVAAKGFEAIGAEMMAYSKTCFEDGIAATKAVMGAKTYNDVVNLQNDYAQAALQRWLSTGAKLGEMSLKLTNEALQPVNARVASNVEKFTGASRA